MYVCNTKLHFEKFNYLRPIIHELVSKLGGIFFKRWAAAQSFTEILVIFFSSNDLGLKLK